MTSPAQSSVQNLLPVQAYFDLQDNFITFIGQNKPFTAPISPNQSGLNITSSTINSTTIGATTPSTGVFTNMSTTTGQVANAPSGATDLINKAYADALQIGLSFKNPANCATTANITLSGLQTIDGYTTLSGDRVLVKNQTTSADNGIYNATTGAWSRAADADIWQEYVSAFLFVESGSTYAGTAWYCPALPGGTLGVTAINWNTFTFAASYSAGTGLNLSGTVFSIANTTVTAAAYGSASKTLTATVNAQGQLTALSASDIAITNAQVSGLGTLSTQNASSVTITGGTINGTTIGASTASTGVFTTLGGTTITASTQFSGPGTGLTGTASSLSIGGNAATATSATSATSATTATNVAGGLSGSLPYQTAAGATSLLGIGTTGQVLSVSAGLPSWSNLSSLGVSSFSAGTTGLTPSSVSTGAIVLAGTLAVANGGTGVTTSTGTGSVVLSTSPTFTTPILGTPTSGNLSNCTAFPAGSLGGTTLVSTVVSSSLTSVGTLTSGAWNASLIPLTYGGTNANLTAVAGGAVYSTASALAITAAGTTGQILTSNGSSAPTWSNNAATVSITDDTTTAATRYLLFAAATSGAVTTEYTSSTKLQFNPSTGAFTATSLTPTNALTGTYGGTGVNNGSNTITIGGNVTFSGAFTQTLTATATTSVTLPTTGTLATLAGTETFTNKRITPRVSTTTSSATPTINTDTTDQYGLTALAVNITSFTTNLSGTPTDGQKLWIYIVGTAARTITWGAKFESSTVTLPSTTVTTNRLDVGFVWNAASSVWRCVAVA
jgi:hypothetical protein